jgi:RimJ/RimL family protein N-acetyltransferase
MELSGDLSRTRITSARLTLTAFTADDAAESFVEANARIAKYMSWIPPATDEDFRTIWQETLADMKAGRQLSLTIRLAGSAEFIGSAGLHPADGELLETGIWIKEAAQGHGYGREAVAATVGWASAAFRPAGFLWPVVDENTPSCKLAEALGGTVIGTRQRQKAGDVSRTLLFYRIPAATAG